MFQKVNSRTPYITMIGYQVTQVANNYCEGKFISARETDKHLQTTIILPSRTGGDWEPVIIDLINFSRTG